MANKRNSRKRHSNKFNKPGGMHHFNVKTILKSESEKFKQLKKNVNTSFKIKARKPGLKILLGRISVNRAKKYKCIKDKTTNKIFLLNKEEELNGNRILNLEKLKSHISEVTCHTALCDKARDIAVDGENVVSIISGGGQSF